MKVLLVCAAGMSTSKIMKKVDGLPVDVIHMKDYGRQNCPAFFDQINSLIG